MCNFFFLCSGTAAEANNWVSSSCVRSLAAQGIESTLSAAITLAVLKQTGTSIVSYDNPSLVSPQYSYYMFALVGFGQNPWVVDGDPNVPKVGGHSQLFYIAATGLNFGASDGSPRSRISNSAGVTTKWVSDSVTKCRAPSGKGFYLSMTLTSGEQSGTQTLMISYDTHTVLGPFSSKNTNLAATGCTSVTIFGYNYDVDFQTVGARAGVTTCEASMWVSDSIVLCRVAAGALLRNNDGRIQKDSSMIVTIIAFTISSTSNMFSYNLPTISSGPSSANVAVYPGVAEWISGVLQGPGPDKTGRTLCTITGANYGSDLYTPTTRLSTSRCEASQWRSDTSVSSLSAAWSALIKLKRIAVVSVGALQIGCKSESFSYDACIIREHSRPANAVPAGAGDRRVTFLGWISVVGSHFSSVDITANLREHFTSSQRTIWISDSSLLSGVSAGVAATRIAVITSGISSSSRTEAFSFEAVRVKREYSQYLPFGGAGGFPKWQANGASTDGPALLVTLAGSGMSLADYTPEARISTTGTDSQASRWISDSAIKAKAVPGAGEFGVVRITGLISAGTITNSWTYDMPIISSIWRQNSLLGGTIMLAVGSNFGAEQIGYTAGAHAGDTSCEGTQWISRTALRCVMPAGLGKELKFVVTSLKILGIITNSFSFDSTQVIICDGKSNAISTGSVVLTILGANFGDRDASPSFRVGASKSENTVWISDTSLTSCLPAGVRSTHAGHCTIVTNFVTRTELVSFDCPTITLQSRRNLEGVGRDILTTISGAGFSHTRVTSRVVFGGTISARTLWICDSAVMARSSVGAGMSKLISITVGSEVGSRSVMGTYDNPIIVDMSFTYFLANPFFPFSTTFQRFNMPSYPIGLEMPAYQDVSSFRGSVWLTGSGIISSDATITSRIAATGCEATRWFSNTHVEN